MGRSVQNKAIQQVIQSVHKPQQRNKHPNTKGDAYCRNERLPPPGKQKRFGNAAAMTL